MSCRAFQAVLPVLGALVALPVAAQTVASNDVLQLVFDDRGRLAEAVACHPACADPAARRITLAGPGGVIDFSDVGDGVGDGRWKLREYEERGERVLEYAGPEGKTIRWALPPSGYGIGLAIEGLEAVVLQSDGALQPRSGAGFANWLEQLRYVSVDRGGAAQFGLDDTSVRADRAEWAGFRNRFWGVLVSADRPSRFAFTTAEGNLRPYVVRESSGEPERLLLYLGAIEPRSLAAVDPLLQEVMYAGLWFWLRWFCFGLFYLLIGLQAVIPAWGLAIMVLSVVVGVLMSPLSRAAQRLQDQVHATEARLAPELARIKREYRGEEQAAKILALYKTERVHPLYSLKSLLGVAIVIPVFIGAFDMLAENIHLLNTSFLWIDDLSRPDRFARMPFELPFFGAWLNLLPFIMTALSVLASWLHQPLSQHPDLRRRQLRNMILLAVAFFVLFYTFPAGMVLYWTTNNLISVGKGLWARFRPPASSP